MSDKYRRYFCVLCGVEGLDDYTFVCPTCRRHARIGAAVLAMESGERLQRADLKADYREAEALWDIIQKYGLTHPPSCCHDLGRPCDCGLEEDLKRIAGMRDMEEKQWNRRAPDPMAERLAEALSELVDLMDGVCQGEYTPDSFTTQPARAALEAWEGRGLR